MPMPPEELRRALNVDEPDYPRLAARLDASDLPALQAIAANERGQLAAAAIYVASLLPAPKASEIVLEAAASTDEIKRIAAGSALENLAGAAKERVAERLVADRNPAIVKLALRGISRPSAQLAEKIRRLDSDAALPELRELARSKLRER